jgi:hypothetical protein
VNGTNNREIVTAGLKLIKLAIGKECHFESVILSRIEEPDFAQKRYLVLECLMCASRHKAYDASSPTMDILRAYLDSIAAGEDWSV